MRCQCKGGECPCLSHWGNTIPAGGVESPKACTNQATRYVVVEFGYRPFQDICEHLCEWCANYHAKRAQEEAT